LRGSRVWMATGNPHKYGEAREILSEYGVELGHFRVEKIEIQADDPEEIAMYSLDQIEDVRPLFVEDAGIFIDHYGGFPGPYSEYALRKIDLPGILKLMEGIEEREASFQSVIAYRHGNGRRCFRGEVKGAISLAIKGTNGFGYDPVFIPHEGDGRTFGEMEVEEKNAISHRARAIRSLGKWLASSK
jgi:XTP/dITP diphosphohydrolase